MKVKDLKIGVSSILYFIFLSFNGISQENFDLNGEWQFKELSWEKWYSAKVPSVVHTDLLTHDLIQDPYWRSKEEKLSWIEEKEWHYKKEFEITAEHLTHDFAELNFDGLDTYAEVYLNGALVLEAQNMHKRYRFNVKNKLQVGKNVLEIRFIPLREALAKVYSARTYELPSGCETVEEKYSPYVRKAAYHFGWDWGPRFVTCGIWRGVKISFFNAEISEAFIYTEKIMETHAELMCEVQSKFITPASVVRLICEGDTVYDNVRESTRTSSFHFSIQNPKLWWANGTGKPNMYKARVEVLSKDLEVLAVKEVDFGVRTIELINEKDSIGTSFYFRLNGQPVFMKGANYIPQDVFLPRVSDDQYKELIQKVKNAEMNMIRVWGGGVYEKDLFYDLCDQNGILVWQDFMFAGSMYPGFLYSEIGEEVEDNIKRLRNHPCIAVWCGNNEMEVAWNNWGWQKQFGWSAADSTEIWKVYKSIFHELIPEKVKLYDPSRSYTSTSPLSNWGTAENFNYSSMHYWGVWHGREPFENYEKNVGRFMVEYGFQSFPSMKTIKKFSKESDWDLASEVMKDRQKSYIGNEEIIRQVEKYYGKVKSFEEFVKRSQDVQAKALELAIKAHLKKQPHCMGSLFWQLNDCWPGPSWSIIDYYGEEKKAYKKVKKLFKNQKTNEQ